MITHYALAHHLETKAEREREGERARQKRGRVEMKGNSSSIVFTTITIIIFGFSAIVNSQTDSCSSSLNLQSVTLPFDATSLHCHAVWDSQNYILRYSETTPGTWTFVLSAPAANSYIAMGFSSNGQMIGSSAIVGWISSTEGGVIKRYYLGGTSPNLVEPNKGNLVLTNFSFITTQASTVYMGFQLVTEQPQTKLIYSVGPTGMLPVSPNYRLNEHFNKVSTTINYITGQTSSTGSPYTRLRRSHGILNMLGWGILMIIGVIVARHLKSYEPLWFYLHVGIQSLAFVFGIIGVICGFVLDNKINADVSTHKALGIFILVLGCLQVMAFLARPDKVSKSRKYWNWYHQTVGRLLIILAVANVFYGIHLGEEGTGWNAGYGVVLAILVVIAVILELKLWFRK
ncbi:cytochrome b561 and DOMON domain-containing protein At3g07570 [Argentina anserina]|uniref:cytochrome b561 and DOMON domain-containing protein At3g07570 n=1 Tax=Argentina anserina TaxID=57926 RepID=UPI0021764247|nr:cytochrome b561 and DOMON domain-containing protein At3g07570 [Potentilla anserina]